MKRTIDIDMYLDGFNYDQLNCVDITIAGAAGSYNYDNYYYYGFYFSFFSNWTNINNLDFFNFRNIILKKLGLKMVQQKVNDTSQFISLLKSSIDMSSPVLILANYKALFYAPDYLSDFDAIHGIIVSDYYPEKSIFIIRDPKIVDRITNPSIGKAIKSDPLYKLQLTEDMLCDIWTKSNRYFKDKYGELPGIVYSIEKIDCPQVAGYSNLPDDIIHNYDFGYSKFNNFINGYKTNEHELKSNPFSGEYLRKTYLNSLTIFFNILEKALETPEPNNQMLNEFIQFKNNFMTFRKNTISKLYADILRGKEPDDNYRHRVIEQAQSMDNRLQWYISENNNLCKVKYDYKSNKPLINYALGADALADSELKYGDIHCKASQAVDGKWVLWADDMWNSDASSKVHWLQVDLRQPRTITKFVIRHQDIKGYITRDFQIQGSDNGNEWVDLVVVKDNDDGVTVHEITPCTFRYFRLYITDACELDYYTRIHEFEAWG